MTKLLKLTATPLWLVIASLVLTLWTVALCLTSFWKSAIASKHSEKTVQAPKEKAVEDLEADFEVEFVIERIAPYKQAKLQEFLDELCGQRTTELAGLKKIDGRYIGKNAHFTTTLGKILITQGYNFAADTESNEINTWNYKEVKNIWNKKA